MVFYRQGCRAKWDLSAAAFCMVRSDAPFALRSVPLGETALTRFPLLAQLSFAYKRAFPQSKLMDENSYKHDFRLCDSDWLNCYVKIRKKQSPMG